MWFDCTQCVMIICHWLISVINNQTITFQTHTVCQSLQMVVSIVGNTTQVLLPSDRPRTSEEEVTLMSLWLLATQETFRQVAGRFDAGVGQAYRCYRFSHYNLHYKLADNIAVQCQWITNYGRHKSHDVFTDAGFVRGVWEVWPPSTYTGPSHRNSNWTGWGPWSLLIRRQQIILAALLTSKDERCTLSFRWPANCNSYFTLVEI